MKQKQNRLKINYPTLTLSGSVIILYCKTVSRKYLLLIFIYRSVLLFIRFIVPCEIIMQKQCNKLSLVLLFFAAARELTSHDNDTGRLTACSQYVSLLQCDQRKDKLSNVTLRKRQKKSNWDSRFLFFSSSFF